MIKRLLFRLTLFLVIALAVSVCLLQFLAIRSISSAIDEPALALQPFTAGVEVNPATGAISSPQPVVFVGNNWQGTVTVIDGETHEVRGVLNGIPDKVERLQEVKKGFVQRMLFYGVKQMVGEGHNQYVDDMYSSLDGRSLIVSRPSFADVIALDIASGQIIWRFPVAGFRADHMALSPDGRHVAVSASTGNVVHIIDVQSGKEFGQFPTGDSPHENVFSKDGSQIFHASIGRVFTPLDFGRDGWLKGERLFQVVDAQSMKILEQFDLREKLDTAGMTDITSAIRPMAHSSDENLFYFQLSFFHGFVEYNRQQGRISRKVELPKYTTATRNQYVNDSAHHGIAISGDDSKLCVAGTMDDYVAIVDAQTMQPKVLTGLGEKPYWAVTDQSGQYCYISWSGSDQMSIIRYSDATEVKRIDVGDHPQRVREGVVLFP